MTYKDKKEQVIEILMDFLEEYENNSQNRPSIPGIYADDILTFLGHSNMTSN